MAKVDRLGLTDGSILAKVDSVLDFPFGRRRLVSGNVLRRWLRNSGFGLSRWTLNWFFRLLLNASLLLKLSLFLLMINLLAWS